MNNTKKTIRDFKKTIDSGLKDGSISFKMLPNEDDPDRLILVINNLSGKVLYNRKEAADLFGIKNYGDVMVELWKKYSAYQEKDCYFVILDHIEKIRSGDEITMFYFMVYGKGAQNIRKWWY